MILTDREIKIAIEQNAILIRPLPEADAFSSTMIDLTLDPHLNEFKPGPSGGVDSAIDPMNAEFNPEETLKQVTNQQTIDPANGYRLKCEHLVLGWTREYVEIPIHSRLATRVEGKSSRARFGLGIHITAPTIHAGFTGRIRLEMVNHGTYPIILRSGMPICQLVFEQTLGTPQKGYQGNISGSDGGRKLISFSDILPSACDRTRCLVSLPLRFNQSDNVANLSKAIRGHRPRYRRCPCPHLSVAVHITLSREPHWPQG